MRSTAKCVESSGASDAPDCVIVSGSEQGEQRYSVPSALATLYLVAVAFPSTWPPANPRGGYMQVLWSLVRAEVSHGLCPARSYNAGRAGLGRMNG